MTQRPSRPASPVAAARARLAHADQLAADAAVIASWGTLPGAERWPAPGFWAGRLAKGAPEVAMSIAWEISADPDDAWHQLDRSPLPVARINGEAVLTAFADAEIEAWRDGRPVYGFQLDILRPITKAEHDWLVADRAWARQFAPDSAEAHPRRAVLPTPKPAEPPAPKPDLRQAAPIY